MTQILACQHAELFAAVASVTPGEIPDPCVPSHPVSVLEVCASEDPIVKIDLCSNIIGNWTRNDGCNQKKPTFKVDRVCTSVCVGLYLSSSSSSSLGVSASLSLSLLSFLSRINHPPTHPPTQINVGL